MKKSYKIILCLVLAVALVLCGCSKRETPIAEATPTPTPAPAPTEAPVAEVPVEPTAEPEPVPTPMPTPEPLPVSENDGFVNPLTGEPMEEDISMLRPITVMLNNHVNALPQCGISSADIIYEMPEEGITRMLGVYSQLPDCERLGSIRSTRPYHIDVSLSYDAIFVHWGRSQMAANMLWNTGIDHIELNENPAGTYAYRDSSHSGYVEHTGFIKTEKLQQFLDDKDWRTEHEGEHGYGFRFTDEPNLSGSGAEQLLVGFAGKYTNFFYDADQKGYTMAQYQMDYVDGDTGEAPVFRNVLVLRATIYDETGLASIVLTDTSGTGYLFCDGKYEEIKWSRGGYDDNFEYFKADGTPLSIGVGKSYVCIVSGKDRVEFE